MLRGCMGNHRVDPRCLGSGRTAYTQSRTHSFYCPRGMIVQLEVGGLRRPASPEIDIRFVPDFEIPACHFIDAVAIDQVLRERLHQRSPLVVVRGRRHDLLVPEGVIVQPRSHLFGRKTQLDKRLDAVIQQAVIDVVDVGPVVDRLAILIFVVHAHFVMKDGMEAHVLEVGRSLHCSQIASIVFAQRQHCPARAEHLFPVVRERRSCSLRIHNNRLRSRTR